MKIVSIRNITDCGNIGGIAFRLHESPSHGGQLEDTPHKMSSVDAKTPEGTTLDAGHFHADGSFHTDHAPEQAMEAAAKTDEVREAEANFSTLEPM